MPSRSEIQIASADSSALRLLDALLRSRVDARSVTSDQRRNFERWCAKTAEKRSQKIKRLLSEGQYGCAHRRQVSLWRSPAARLHAAFEAVRTENRRLRSRGITRPPASFERVWRLSERLKNDFAKSLAVPRFKRKRDGLYRRYYVFNVFGIAKQKLFVNALKPFAGSHPSQFMLSGERPAACEKLLRYANTGPIQGKYFVKADVRAYYDMIAHRYLEEMLPAPKAIIRNTLLLHGWGGGVTMDQRGVPQGSAASSLVGEMVMADLLTSAAGALPACLITYADDIGGLVPLRADAFSLAERLTHAFETHGAGPFRLRVEIEPVYRAFRFLGYEFELMPEAEAFKVNAPPGLSESKHIEFVSALAEAQTLQDLLAVCRRLQSFCAAYSLASDVQEMVADVLRFLRIELQHRRAVAA